MNTPTEGVDVARMRVGVLLNTASGSCDAESEGVVRELLAASSVSDPLVWCADASGLSDAFAEISRTPLDLLIVLGGDGTIKSAIEAVSTGGTKIVPLPGGTMNMLPKALYGDRSWQDALRDTLQNPVERKVSAGKVGKDYFFVAAILGGVSEVTKAREALREGHVLEAAKLGTEALAHAFDESLSYTTGGLTQETAAIALICPLTSKVLKDEAPLLELIALNMESARDTLSLATAAAFGEWRTAQNVVSVNVTGATIAAPSGISAVLDGEVCAYEKEVEVSFVPAAFTALVPAEGE